MAKALESLLRIRLEEEKQAKMVFRDASRDLLCAKEQQAIHDSHANAAKQHYDAERHRPIDLNRVKKATSLHGRGAFLTRLDNDRKKHEAAAKNHREGPLWQAQCAESKARADLSEKRKQREALEKHLERLAAEEKVILGRREEAAADDRNAFAGAGPNRSQNGR